MLHPHIAAAFLLLLLAPLPRAATYQVDNLSPSIIYDPPLCGEREPEEEKPVWYANWAPNAWNTTYLNRSWREWELVKQEWHHYTWAVLQEGMSAPTAVLSFVGQSVAVVGPPAGFKPKNIGTGTAEIELDGRVIGTCKETLDDVQVRCKYMVEWGRHNLTVRIVEGAFAIDHFDVATGVHEAQTPVQVPLVNGADFNQGGEYSLTPSGGWNGTSRSVHQDVNGQAEWTRAMTETYRASVSIAVPRGTTRVSVLGAVDLDHGPFQVTLVPPSYGLFAFWGNAWNLQAVQGVSMFDTVLDPAVSYTLQVTNLAPSGAYLDISHFQFYRANSSNSGGLSGGAIAGIVVGCVAGVAIAALLGWLLYRRRHTHRDQIDIEPEAGQIVHHQIEPFHDYRSVSTNSAHVLGAATLRSTTASPPASSSHYTGHNSDYPDALAHTVGMPLTSKATPVTIQHVHHVDGGAIAQPQAVQTAVLVEETPPTYNPDWTGSGANAAGPGGGASRSAEAAQSEKSAPALVASASSSEVLGPSAASVDASVSMPASAEPGELNVGYHERR